MEDDEDILTVPVVNPPAPPYMLPVLPPPPPAPHIVKTNVPTPAGTSQDCTAPVYVHSVLDHIVLLTFSHSASYSIKAPLSES
jgi:hypothetical protein